ncbi:MAG: hypothetical protein ABI175_06630, partial [Polyangiales bacterium]
IVLALCAVARGDDLDEARRLEAALDYEHALVAVDGILAKGGARYPDRFVELQLFAGRLAAGLDRGAVAEDHYLRALAIRPAATLPEGTSPKLVAPLDAARRRATALKVSVIAVDGAVSFLVDADGLGLVRGIALTVTGTGGRRELVDRAALRMAVPKGVTAIEVAALDASGNVVFKDVPPAPIVVTALPVGPRMVDDGPSVPARWSTWAIATGVIVGAGAFSAWRFNIAQHDWDELRKEPEMHDFSALTAVEDRGRRWGLAANIAFGVAAATGITAVVLYYRQRHARVLVSATGIGGEF